MGRKSLGHFDCHLSRGLVAPGFVRVACVGVALGLASSIALVAQATRKQFTLQQVLSAPFNSELIAAPVKNRFAWISNAEGRRNIWVAEPSGDGYTSRAITNYTHDDGQEISGVQWSPEADSIVYVRGSDPDNAQKMSANPALLPQGVEQDVWLASLDGSAPRKLGPGNSPAFSTRGDAVAWVLDGQIWFLYLNGTDAKPTQLLHTLGTCETLRWSPDGTALAFVSDRQQP